MDGALQTIFSHTCLVNKNLSYKQYRRVFTPPRKYPPSLAYTGRLILMCFSGLDDRRDILRLGMVEEGAIAHDETATAIGILD